MRENEYDAKFKDMQKYLPFIQRVIDRLKVNNDQMADNPRKAQLEKMEKVHDLLTNKVKNIKLETLIKCENVIKRLQQKLEMQPSFQNEDGLLNKVQLKRPSAPSPATLACPASPPPEVHADSSEQPVVIPTERRCSPILLKEKTSQLQKLPQTQTIKDSQNTSTHSPKESSFSHERYDANRIASAQTNNQHHCNRLYYDNRSSSLGPSHTQTHKRTNTILPNEKPAETEQKLQTVKVVITEPLPAHVKQQHFPSSSKYLPRTSVCHNNLKTLPQVSHEQDNEAYNPEESWQQYNESFNNSFKGKQSVSPVFKRLRAKVLETLATTPSSTSKPSGRYTPIPDVLKSPPLSVNDINNLLLESGVNKDDISAIGTRRPPKTETDVHNSPSSSFELSRKKLADSIRNSPIMESPKQRDNQEQQKSSTNLPHERIALKYNPHPRQERLQSLSSTDGSECSTQSKINDPRIKHKVVTSPAPQSSPANVNVLPAINCNDPRLKKQHFPNTPTNLRQTLPNILPAQLSTPVMGYGQSSFMGCQDPRMARQQNNLPARRTSISQPHYSSEENWDSDDQDKTKMLNKSDPRLDKRPTSRRDSRCDNIYDNRARSFTPKPDSRSRSCTPKPGGNYVCKSFLNTNATDVSCPRSNVFDSNKNLNKHKKEPKNTLEPSTPIIIPNPPKSDTEEDWDSEPEVENNKLKSKMETAGQNPKPETLPITSTNTMDNVTKSIPVLNSIESIVKSPQSTFNNSKTLLNYATSPVHTIGPPTNYKPPPSTVNTFSNSYKPPVLSSHPGPPAKHPIPIIGPNHKFALQHPAANSHLNTGSFYERSERYKYYEAKNQSQRCDTQPRTYREFREAKERAMAQEAALKRAAEAAEVRKKAEAFKENDKGKEKETLEEPPPIRDKQTPKDELNKKIDEKKSNTINSNKTSNKEKDKPCNAPVESTLDKMYRTQNFSTQFPKASSSFKIPKKKTEEKPKEETKNMETTVKSSSKVNKEDKQLLNKSVNSKEEEHKLTNDNKEKSKENVFGNTKEKSNTRDPRCRTKTTVQDKEDSENKESEHDVMENDKETAKKKADENSLENNDNNISSNAESSQSNIQNVGDDIKISSDTQVNLDKFNQLAQDLSSKPQRVLRRRNTMVVFDSAPLVDKEKLKKANAKLFEDVQEEERKRKRDEENRIARRNKNLEEMFKKTDDNCTVSVQNIIEGKRRTRPNINFNETANVSKVFKRTTIKDAAQTPPANAASAPAPTLVGANFKIKLAKIDMKPVGKQNEKADNEEKESKKGSKQKQDESEAESEENEQTSEEENNTKTRKIGPKSKTRRVNKKQKEIEKDPTEEEVDKAMNAMKAKVSKANNKLEDSGDKSLEKEQNDEVEPKETKIKNSVEAKGNKKDSEESKERKEENLKEESKPPNAIKSKKTKTVKVSNKLGDTEEETDKTDVNKDSTSKEVKTKKLQSTEEDTDKESETSEQNKTQNQLKPENSNNTDQNKERNSKNLTSKKSKVNEGNNSEIQASSTSNNEVDFQSIVPENEHQHCVESPTTTDNTPKEFEKDASTTLSKENTTLMKTENDDIEALSTSSKSLNGTPTPEANVEVLPEIVENLINNNNRERILDLLGEIISKEKINVIKSIIYTNLKRNEEDINKQETEINKEQLPTNQENKQKTTERSRTAKHDDNNETEDEEEDRDFKSSKTTTEERGKKQTNAVKKKRNELDRLNEYNREMFISKGVLTAMGRRMCNIMGEKSPEQTDNTDLRKSTNTRNLRRSLRATKAQDETEEDDNISLSTRNSEVSLDDMERVNSAESSPQRKMPVLKPHTPIKIPEEVSTKETKTKELNKRKTDNKSTVKNKKIKLIKDDTETEIKDSEREADEEEDKTEEEPKTDTSLVHIKNNNVHWHYQSKFLTWCMICEKRLNAKIIAVHYKTHHGECYISRLSPVILQQIKQGKLNRPWFGVNRGQQRNSWFFRCPFCLQYFNTPQMLWLEHFLNHTVEFRYECSKCHRCNNRRQTVQRHVKYCEGGTIVTSAVKLTVPTEIKAHVCHLCNFLQLKRPNLERHYMEQHQIDKKTVEMSGYTITLLDVANVECVTEDKAVEREKEAWEIIKKNEQVITCSDEDNALETSTVDTDDLDKNLEIEGKKYSNRGEEIENNELKSKQKNDLNIDSRSKDGDLDNEDIPKDDDISKPNSKPLQNKQVLESYSKEQPNIAAKVFSVEELSTSLIENQETDTASNEDKRKKKHKTDLKHTKKAEIEEPKKSVLSDLEQSKDVEQIKDQNDSKMCNNLEQTTETTAEQCKTLPESKNLLQSKDKPCNETVSKTISLEKNQNSSKESIESFNDNEKNSENIHTSESSGEIFTLVYESNAEDRTVVISDCEVINEIDTQQDVQDELLTLAAQAANSEQEKVNEKNVQDELLTLAAHAAEKEQETKTSAVDEIQAQTSMSDIISSSIDLLYKRGSSSKRKSVIEDYSDAKKICPNQSNVDLTKHEEERGSLTRQISPQTLNNIEDSTGKGVTNIIKPISMIERLSQRLNSDNKTPTLPETNPKENQFEKLLNDTLKELEIEKDCVSKQSSNDATSSVSPAPCSSFSSALSQVKENVSGKLSKPLKDVAKQQELPKESNQSKLRENVLTISKEADRPREIAKDLTEKNTNTPSPTQEIITIISDDEDWEDIEITETAPAVPCSSTGNIAKSKNKGLFQKFGSFKGNINKNKKHLTPLAFMPKKKNKDKTSLTNNTTSSTTNTTPIVSPSNLKPNTINSTTNNNNSVNTSSSSGPTPTAGNVTSSRSATNSPFTHLRHNLGFKPVINIMDDLLPDSPCNDPIDLVPELAPLEPLQDLNDISSILDSNLSAVNINVNNNQTSIEEALDFVNEQQQIQEVQVPDNQNSNSNSSSSNTSSLTSTKCVVNSIYHVGFSKQSSGENPFKFYCLLKNCSFLFSSDAMGLETHFIMEHAQIKWNGYCYMCEEQCVTECSEGLSITKEIKHMMDKHANNTVMEITNNDSNSCSAVVQEDRPKIKLRRLTGDCLSRTTPEIKPTTSTPPATKDNPAENKTKPATGSRMLGALLEAKPKPPTRDMPPQPEMPLTEPLLLDNNKIPENTATKTKPQNTNTPSANNDGSSIKWLRIDDVTVLLDHSPYLSVKVSKENPTPSPLQIKSVVSLNSDTNSTTPPVPKISNVRSLTQKAGNLRSQQIDKGHMELEEAAAESWEISRIFANVSKLPATNPTDSTRTEDDSPVIVAETVPIAQNKTGDFVITQTLSAQYNEKSSTHLGFNINIAATSITAPDNTNKDTANTSETPASSTISSTPVTPSFCSITSRQYKCMAAGCKFVSRVPVAMSEHLRFHERRNFSNKRDYLSCGFCFYTANDVEDYMKHADQYHIINKTGAPPPGLSNNSETDTATSLTKKILNILNSSASGNSSSSSNNNSSSGNNLANTASANSATYSKQMSTTATNSQVPDTEEVYLKKLRDTIDEMVGPTGLADDKLYRCVIKNCQTQLTESTFLTHIMYHINMTGQNPQHYTYKCPHCSAQYNRASGIKVHIKNHARNRYFCYLCEQTTANAGQLQKHFSEKHWHTMQMYTKVLLKPKLSTDGSNQVLDSGYFVVYTQDLSEEEVRKFGEKLILDWQRKKAGSKTHYKSSEIDLLPMTAIFTRDINCGECEYKTKVRTNMYRHLQMHKQNPDLANKPGVTNVYSVDPVNPVPCLNSSERFFDKMTNLASSSLIPNTSTSSATTNSKNNFKIPYAFVESTKRLTCHLKDCNYHTISEELFRTHMTTLHGNIMLYRCGFCQEDVCKRGIATDRIIYHLRFHGACIYRCEECNYLHYLRHVVERHINEKHPKMKVNIVKHDRTIEDNMEGVTTALAFAGKKYKESTEPAQASTSTTRSNSENSTPAPSTSTTTKGKGKWVCDVCGQKAASVTQIQTHCQQQHGVKNQYKCVHCTFGSQQLSQILAHIDAQHSGMVREAHTMYHREESGKEKIADTRPLWQRNDPTRVRHIRGILMEEEDESLTITEEDIADDNEELEIEIEVEEGAEELNGGNYLAGYEFGCFHCDYKAQTFEQLKEQHYQQQHKNIEEKAKPFWYRLLRKFCCPECRAFVGIYKELEQHLKTQHSKVRFYGADVTTLESGDNTLRLLCGFCPVHCANAEDLLKHQLRLQHTVQDVRIDNNQQIMDILNLGQSEVAYQCALCTDIFPNRVAIVEHACNTHAGEESFSFRELSNSLIYRCHICCFTSTTELDLMRHMLDHYTRFKTCQFCGSLQNSFTNYMQHCYAQHKNDIHKFKNLYPLLEIRKFLLQMLIVFPSGLVLNKRNLLNTKYGKTDVIDELYEEMYKISQEPPIPRLSIARLVARKSIEAQHKHLDSVNKHQDDVLEALQAKQPKPISKRRRTLVVTLEENKTNSSACNSAGLKPKINVLENKPAVRINKRRITVDQSEQQQHEQFSAPLQMAKISKRRRTVAVDRDTLFSSNLSFINQTNLLMENQNKKRKCSAETLDGKVNYPLNLDMEPFSYYGQKPEPIDLTKIYTKVAIGGIKTPLTIDKFKLLFNIECQLKLTKCDEERYKDLWNYNQYKHIKKACPASHKIKYK